MMKDDQNGLEESVLTDDIEPMQDRGPGEPQVIEHYGPVWYHHHLVTGERVKRSERCLPRRHSTE